MPNRVGGVNRPSTGAAANPRARVWRRRIAILSGTVVGLLSAGLIGYALNASPSHRVSVEKTFTGKVTIVGNDGQSGCVRPDEGGPPVCSDFYTARGTVLHVGDTVEVADETVHTDGGNGYTLLMVYQRRSA